jgi:hypothetical protein
MKALAGDHVHTWRHVHNEPLSCWGCGAPWPGEPLPAPPAPTAPPEQRSSWTERIDRMLSELPERPRTC